MRVDNDLVDGGVPLQGNQDPPQVNQVPPLEQAPVIPSPIKDGEILLEFLTFAQSVTTQANVVATHTQVITSHKL